MGADLYIGPLFQRQREEWESEFEKAAHLRDTLPEGDLPPINSTNHN
jgi:hypothetical protein